MSNSIDERIVSMKLNNSQFEANARKTLGTLGDLSKGLKLENAGKGLANISAAAKNTNLDSLANSVDGIAKRFTTMGIIGTTALVNVANRAVDAGLAFAKSLAIQPITDGFSEYELKMGSIQTMLANTARYGTKLPEISKNLNELNTYSDKTIYNFGDMTKNIGLFTNAGLRIGDATKMIQGFSNVAAASGTSAMGAAGAAYQLSQALSAGKITLMDWKSLTNVGMGNANMKDGILDIALALGTVEKGSKKAKEIQKDFNGSLKSGWLTAGVMSKYLKIMATDFGSMNKKQLEAQKTQLRGIGLSNKTINRLIAEQKMAQKSATEVRTFSQLLGTVKESIGSGWSETFEIILGNFTQATKLFTNINDAVGDIVGKMSKARNDMLRGWAKAGGRVALIEGFKNAFQALGIIIKAVKDAFTSVFPPTTGKQLAEMTKNFRDFTAKLKMGGETANNLKRTFAGVFAIFKVGYTIIKFVATTLFNLFGIAQGGGGSFLALTAAVGDFIVKIQDWLISNGKIKEFFATINTARLNILVPLISIIGRIAEAFAALFQGDYKGFLDGLKGAFGDLGPLISGIWKNATSSISGYLAQIRDFAGIASEFLKSLGIQALEPIQRGLAKISENFGKLRLLVMNFGFDIFNKGAKGASSTMSTMSGIGERVRTVWASIKEAFESVQEFLGPVGDSISKLFTTITNKVAEFIEGMDMQDAIALVNTAFFIMMYKAIRDFMKNMDGLIDSFKGIGDEIKDTLGVIKTTLTDALSTMQQNVKANIILKIAIAIGVLAASLWVLSTIDPGKLAMAVGAVGILMVGMTKTMGAMLGMLDTVEGEAPKKMGSILATGGALLMLSAGILLLSFAVKNIAGLSWENMAKGLIGTGVLLGALGLFVKFADMEKQSMKGAASLAILAGAIYLLTFSVSKLGEMDTGKLIQGGVAVAAILGMMAGTAVLFAQFGNKGAPGVIAMAGALAILTPVIMALGLVPYENLAKGIGTIAIALGLLAGTAVIMAMWGNKGAPGMIAMAGALAILTPVILALGMADLPTLAKGLGTIAIALGLLAGASILMGNPMALSGSIGILAMAGALAMLAPVVLMLGQADLKTLALGLGAIAVGFGILIVAGAAAMVVAPGLLVLGQAIGLIGVAMLAAGLGFLAFSAGFAALVAVGTAGFAVLTVGFSGLLNLIPLLAQQVGMGLIAIAVVISGAGPRIIRAITVVLISFLKAIQNAAPQFFSTMSTLIMGLVRTIERLVPQIAAAGARMIIRLLSVLATYVGPMATKATDLMLAFINAIAKNVPRLVDGGMKAVIALINGVASAIRGNSAELNAAGRNVASAIVEGMVGGITGGISSVVGAAKRMAQSALSAAKGALGIHSPSREFAKLGKFSVEGFAKGLHGNKPAVDAAMKSMKTLLSDTLKAVNKDVVDAQAKLSKLTKARHKDYAAIKKAQKALAEARAEQKKVMATNNMVKTWSDEQKKLGALANSYDAVTKKLADAKKVLVDATKARDDYAKSVTDQYDNLPSFDKDTKLTDFVASMEKQVVDTQLFTAQLQQLRKMGLSDAMYKELLAKGTEAMPFAQQLLEGGSATIKQVNTLGSALDTAAKSLGSSASKALYQAGVDSAAGLVKGLEKQQAALAKQMDKLADSMVNAIKKKLGIKSPSREFMKVGDWSIKGLAKGLEQSSSTSEAAAQKVGHGTINALRKSLTGLSDAVAANVDVDPTIRPVLDLSQVRKDSVKMGAMLGGHDISVRSTFAKARAASADYSANQTAREQMAMAGGDSLTFNQYNNSPKALSEATIYRQTKNQISTAKGALKN